MFSTPILLITFNRPEHTRQVFERIKKTQPATLYIFRDGPRKESMEDEEKCAEVQKLFDEPLNWSCKLYTRFSDVNLGCGYGPAEAINWFFENVEQGIILEDDCLPSLSFFPFCEELLQKYKNDTSIQMINGFNSMNRWKSSRGDYFKSYLSASWGWATWKRAWENFDYNIKSWANDENKKTVKNILGRDKVYSYFAKDFNSLYEQSVHHIWDTQWLCTRLIHQGRTITPSLNLISNIGFGEEATHTFSKTDKQANSKVHRLKFPLKPISRKTDRLYDWLIFERFFSRTRRTFFRKFILKMVRTLYRTN